MEILENEAPPRQLRALVATPVPPVQALMPEIPAKERRLKEQLADMHSIALALNHTCTPLTQIVFAVGSSMASRMCTRGANFIYQLAADTVPLIPRTVVEQWMPAYTLETSTPAKAVWKSGTSSFEALRAMVGPLISKGGAYCTGITKGLKSDSERVIRVVATAIPQIEIVTTKRMGMEVLRYEFPYVLATESGELRFPKDGNKIEIAYEPHFEAVMREEILSDIVLLHQQGAPLSPGFLRQIGKNIEADVLEAQLLNQAEQTELLEQAPLTGKKRRRPSGKTWTVDCIVEERPAPKKKTEFRVRWVGYHPTWETAYTRAGGQPGAPPFETWEPLKLVLNTEALITWRAQ